MHHHFTTTTITIGNQGRRPAFSKSCLSPTTVPQGRDSSASHLAAVLYCLQAWPGLSEPQPTVATCKGRHVPTKDSFLHTAFLGLVLPVSTHSFCLLPLLVASTFECFDCPSASTRNRTRLFPRSGRRSKLPPAADRPGPWGPPSTPSVSGEVETAIHHGGTLHTTFARCNAAFETMTSPKPSDRIFSWNDDHTSRLVRLIDRSPQPRPDLSPGTRIPSLELQCCTR